jgi:dTDP-4-dehydrorhamnose 3,5-epimerase
MSLIKTEIEGLLIFEPRVFEDSRGYFFEAYNVDLFEQEGINIKFIQDNQSYSSYGVIRGLHYQLQPHGQVKLVRVIQGTIMDVAVDLRKGSPTYGKTFSLEMSAENKKQLLIPAGFAHGFSVLSPTATILYKCSALYNKESEAGIRFDDPDLNINWGVPVGNAIISEKDQALPLFKDCKNNFTF